MNTSQIELAANRGDLATADFQIGLVLRSMVVPAFLEDVGRIGWRKNLHTVTVAAGSRLVTMPEDFFEVADVLLAGDTKPLAYIGEDPTRVAQAEADSSTGALESYYLVRDPVDPNRWAVKFNRAAGSSRSVTITYYWYVAYGDDSQDVDMRRYIPEQYHWALVDLLRREIIDDRYGQGDQRYTAANLKYQDWLKRIHTKRELAPRGNRADYMR